ncbi:hypothetical protein D0Y65_005191 [Glycine soja]|uniref:alpha-galactosidase n=1 Tax=Glycine soja TaxID=3848 RepID=A0A445LUJ2_GLYSO|nr:hypothetical protein D0Y65_005191 [Glycine soja]
MAFFKRGRGFTDVANKVHSKGLKFGIHLMAGISTQAFNNKRDFATSNLIGGKGLKGKSWPDLDMLSFGWLTDPEGRHLSNLNITLVNGHSGMCAIVEHVLAEGYANGIRSWIATGRKGETYVAFFNLNNEKTTISASIVDLAMVHPGRRKFRLCSGNEMWSGRTIQTNNMFSAEVQGHGCALFVLQCSRICPKILFEYLLFIFQVAVMFWFVFCQVVNPFLIRNLFFKGV